MSGPYQVRFVQIPRWLAVLAGLAAVAFAVALFLLSITVFLVLLPVIVVAGGIYYVLARLRRPSRGQPQAHTVDILEGEYRVIEPDENERRDSERR